MSDAVGQLSMHTQDHGFHVGLALEFEEYVVTLLLSNMVFQVSHCFQNPSFVIDHIISA